MTAAQFQKWRQSLGLSKTAAARALGMSRTTIDQYESGRHRIPLYVELACRELNQQATSAAYWRVLSQSEIT